jgi:hypothetical protein
MEVPRKKCIDESWYKSDKAHGTTAGFPDDLPGKIQMADGGTKS